MYNDPAQMREALAWRLLRDAACPRRGTRTAKLAFDATYYGLFSVIEQVEQRFLTDHFGANHHGNLYKAYCGDVGCATLNTGLAPTATIAAGSTTGPTTITGPTGSRPTRTAATPAPTMTWLSSSRRSTVRGFGGGEGRFDTDAFRESVDAIMNARAFLRSAAVNLLLGGWDNYYATRPIITSTTPGPWAPNATSWALPISPSSRGTTTTAWASTTSARNGSTPTSWIRRPVPGATGGDTQPHAFPWCGTCCAIMIIDSIMSISSSSWSIPRSARTRSASSRRRLRGWPMGPRLPGRLPGVSHALRSAVYRPPVHQR